MWYSFNYFIETGCELLHWIGDSSEEKMCSASGTNLKVKRAHVAKRLFSIVRLLRYEKMIEIVCKDGCEFPHITCFAYDFIE